MADASSAAAEPEKVVAPEKRHWKKKKLQQNKNHLRKKKRLQQNQRHLRPVL